MSKHEISEFLEARISEDEAVLERRGTFPHSTHGMDEVGSYNPRCPDCLGLPGKARVLAECAAKRAIIALADESLRAQADRRDASALGAELMHDDVIAALVTAYKDHPDYRQEWAL